jgi:hypothetical protein
LAAVVLFLLAFAVSFFDNLYRLEALEWVPDVLSPLLITGAVFLWSPHLLRKREAEAASSDADGEQGAD